MVQMIIADEDDDLDVGVLKSPIVYFGDSGTVAHDVREWAIAVAID